MMRITYILLMSLLFASCNSSEKKKDFSIVNTSEVNSSDEKIDEQNPEVNDSMARGKIIYTDFCVSCHLPNGKGVPKAFPPLANSDYLMNKRVESIKAIKYGQNGMITVNGEIYNGTMSPLGLEDDEIADVMNYITNSWGNSNDKLISESEVSKIEP